MDVKDDVRKYMDFESYKWAKLGERKVNLTWVRCKRIWANKKLNAALYGSQHNNRFCICNTEFMLIYEYFNFLI